MKQHIMYKKTQTGHRQPNPNFLQQLCLFLSQSKHKKQQQIEEINQGMVEQFIHLFQICNINRYINYTKQFIDEIRNIILRLQLVQKNKYELLDQKDEFMYLIVEGEVQKTTRHKPQTGRRMSKMNMTAFNLGSSPMANAFNTRASHQALNNLNLRQIQKQVIMNRKSRMSLLSGNLVNQILSSPRKNNKTQGKRDKFIKTFSPEQVFTGSPLKAKSSRFRQKVEGQDQVSQDNKSVQNQQNQQNNKKAQLLQPLQNEVYRCVSSVKYIKLLKWSYDQLIQYIYKYQNDRLIRFLSDCLKITEGEIKLHQIYNKTNYVYFKQRQSRHSNQFLKLNAGSLYILRKGSIELKYVCPFSTKKSQEEMKFSAVKLKKNPNLAGYLTQTQYSYKKIVLNEGAIIYPQLQKNQFFIQSLQTVVFVEVNHKVIECFKNQIKNDWWESQFMRTYNKVDEQRSTFMRHQQILQKQQSLILPMQNVFIQTKNRRLHSAKTKNSRFRVGNTENQNQTENINILRQNVHSSIEDKRRKAADQFNSPQYKEFISILPYQLMIKSKQKISAKLNQKSKTKLTSDKVFNYLKKNQKKSSSQKYKTKVLQLKMKNIAGKQINQKDLNNIYQGINGNSVKKKFHNSIKGNWFKEECDNEGEALESASQNKTALAKGSQAKQQIPFQRKGSKSSKSNTQILVLNQKFNNVKRRFQISQIQGIRQDHKKAAHGSDSSNNVDDSEQQQYLCSDDTGLIKNFVGNSRNYQKQISYLMNSSQKQGNFQPHKKKKLKTCKTQVNSLLFSHLLINDIMKRVNIGSNKQIIKSNIKSIDTLNIAKKSTSVCANYTPLNQQIINPAAKKDANQPMKTLFNLKQQKYEQKLEYQMNQKVKTQATKQQQTRILQRSGHLKQHKANSFSNYNSSKSSSCKLLTSNNYSSNFPKSMYNRNSPKSAKQNKNYIQNSFSYKKNQRPATANVENASRLQCKSLVFNEWIQGQPGINHAHQQGSAQWGVPSYNYCQRNIANGDKKIWKKLKSGKIVKKSVQYYNQPTVKSPNFQTISQLESVQLA